MTIQRRELLVGAVASGFLLATAQPASAREINLGPISRYRVGAAASTSFGKTRLLIYRATAKRFVVLDARCPSDGTVLQSLNLKEGQITCQGDGSVFDALTGAVVSGPATKALTRYPVRISKKLLIVTMKPIKSSSSETALIETSKVPLAGGVKVRQGSNSYTVVQPSRGKFLAFSAICTHSGCEVSEFSASAITCTCHGSQFSTADGKVIKGPATRSLASVNIKVRSGMIYLS